MALSTTAAADLASVYQAYNEVTERLMHSHERLMAEVRRLRAELEQKNLELRKRQRLAALGEIAAGVAHEIRNPLGGIGLYASLLERDLAGRPDALELVRRIRNGLGTLESVVGDILTFAGNALPTVRPVRLGDVLASVRGHAAARVAALAATLETAADLQDVELLGDSVQIERALLNLVLNGLDAAGPGGHVWVRGRGPEPGKALYRIAVEDDGPGVDQEQLHRVFTPFFTTKAGGTGLGLAIVHRIAESHGGFVTASNRPRGGAVFVLALPASRVESDQRTKGEAA
jgi:signal transduction histidine kinase